MGDDWGFFDTAGVVALEIGLIAGAVFLPADLALFSFAGAIVLPALFVTRFVLEGAAEAQTDG